MNYDINQLTEKFKHIDKINHSLNPIDYHKDIPLLYLLFILGAFNYKDYIQEIIKESNNKKSNEKLSSDRLTDIYEVD